MGIMVDEIFNHAYKYIVCRICIVLLYTKCISSVVI